MDDIRDHITFRPGDLAAAVASRVQSNASETVRRDLGRYYAILADGLKRIELSRDEACLVADACNGALWDDHSARFVWAEVEDSIRLNRLDEKWKVDGVALGRKLRSLTYAEAVALVDLIERFWRRPNEFDSPLDLISERARPGN